MAFVGLELENGIIVRSQRLFNQIEHPEQISGPAHILASAAPLIFAGRKKTEDMMNIQKGLSFCIADLILVNAWSESQSMRMVVRLDHGMENEAYEEVLALHAADSTLCRWLIWREAKAVFVQPMIGRRQRYDSVIDALEAMEPPKRVAQTQIRATRWPTPHQDARVMS
jgi:hypothetical protein